MQLAALMSEQQAIISGFRELLSSGPRAEASSSQAFDLLIQRLQVVQASQKALLANERLAGAEQKTLVRQASTIMELLGQLTAGDGGGLAAPPPGSGANLASGAAASDWGAGVGGGAPRAGQTQAAGSSAQQPPPPPQQHHQEPAYQVNYDQPQQQQARAAAAPPPPQQPPSSPKLIDFSP